MTSTEKTTVIAMGVAAFLFLALVAGIKFASVAGGGQAAGTGAPAAPGEEGKSTAPHASDQAPDETSLKLMADNAQGHLEAVRDKLTTAKSEMVRATVANKGGFVEKARVDLDVALAHVSEGLDFLAAHPEAGAQPGAAAAVNLPADPGGRLAGVAPNLRNALTNVKEAFDELELSRGGELGGTRAKLDADLRLAAADLISGINYAGVGRNPGTLGRAAPAAARGPAARGRPAETPGVLEGLDSTHDTAMGRLAESQIHVKQMLAQIESLKDGDFGGSISKAQADAKQALDDIAKGMAYVKEHPEINSLARGPYQGLPVIPSPWPPPQIPDYARYATGFNQPEIRLVPEADARTNLSMVSAFNEAELFERAFMPDTNVANTPQPQDMEGRKVVLLGDGVRLMNDLLVGLDYAHSHEPAPAPPPPLPAEMVAPQDALVLEIAPEASVFYPGMVLALQASFRNTSASPLRLRNNGGLYSDWLIHLQTLAGKQLTGGFFQSNGSGTPTARASRPIAPQQALSIVAGFSMGAFSFVEGDLTFEEFQKAAGALAPKAARGGPIAAGVPQELEFPAGTYKVSLTARFPNAVNPDGDATPIWNYDAIASNTTEVTFASLKPEESGSISGTVVGTDGLAAAGVSVAWQRPNPFSNPPEPGSGYANSVANNPNAPQPLAIRPTGMYAGGNVAGTTDASGGFVIRNLVPGIYIVTIRGAPRMSGSMQPVEVKAGVETKLPGPIKLVSGVGSVGGAG